MQAYRFMISVQTGFERGAPDFKLKSGAPLSTPVCTEIMSPDHARQSESESDQVPGRDIHLAEIHQKHLDFLRVNEAYNTIFLKW